MNYFNEVQNVEKEKMSKKQHRKDLISDYTYLVFEKEVINKVPQMIEEMLKSFALDTEESANCFRMRLKFQAVNIHYDEESETCICDILVNDTPYSPVCLDELKDYLQFGNVSFYQSAKDATILADVSLLELVNYYYEELQREEYNKGNGRK